MNKPTEPMSNYEETREAFNRRVNTQINLRMDGSGPTELAWEAWKAALAWRDSGAPEPASITPLEAAIACASINYKVDLMADDVALILAARMQGDCIGTSVGYFLTAARILADEVERLRAAIQRAEDTEKQLLEVAQIVHENSHPQQLRARLLNLLMRHMPDGPND